MPTTKWKTVKVFRRSPKFAVDVRCYHCHENTGNVTGDANISHEWDDKRVKTRVQKCRGKRLNVWGLCKGGGDIEVDVKQVASEEVSWIPSHLNPLTPNDPYSGRTAPLTSKVAFYIFIQQIYVLNILNMVYTLRFSPFKMQFAS